MVGVGIPTAGRGGLYTLRDVWCGSFCLAHDSGSVISDIVGLELWAGFLVLRSGGSRNTHMCMRMAAPCASIRECYMGVRIRPWSTASATFGVTSTESRQSRRFPPDAVAQLACNWSGSRRKDSQREGFTVCAEKRGAKISVRVPFSYYRGGSVSEVWELRGCSVHRQS
jgi:hypothetical protein